MSIELKYDLLGVHVSNMFPALLPVALPPFTPVAVTHESVHTERVKCYTSGFK